MGNLGTEFRVGIFTLLGLAAIIFAVFVINPDLFKREEKVMYFTILDDAAGILPKTHVKTNGVNVGKVSSIELLTNSTKVVLAVDKGVKIPKGSTIEIRTVGFLGDKFIEIKRTDEGELLHPGELIPRNRDTADLNEVIAVIGKIAKDVKKVTGALAETLGDEEGQKSVNEIVDNIREFTRDAKEILADNKGDVRRAVANIEKFSRSLNEVLNVENKEKIDRILASFDDSMLQVKGATTNINLISEKVQKGEGTIGRLVNDDKTLTEVEGAIKELRDVMAPASALQIAVDYHGEYRKDNTSQHYFNLNFHTRPGNYYILGFTDKQQDETDTTIERMALADDKGGNVTRTMTTKKERKALRFNLQIARKWYWAGLRFGLFESTGGLASDFFLFKDRLRFSVEAFDFAEKGSTIRKAAHLKSYVSALFYDHIYAMVGLDDPTRLDPVTGKVNKEPNYFLGAGVNFNDQDIKSLFGLATLAKP